MRKIFSLTSLLTVTLLLTTPKTLKAGCWECVDNACESASSGHSGKSKCRSELTCITSCIAACAAYGTGCQGGDGNCGSGGTCTPENKSVLIENGEALPTELFLSAAPPKAAADTDARTGAETEAGDEGTKGTAIPSDP